jgi:hypothetical protein
MNRIHFLAVGSASVAASALCYVPAATQQLAGPSDLRRRARRLHRAVHPRRDLQSAAAEKAEVKFLDRCWQVWTRGLAAAT